MAFDRRTVDWTVIGWFAAVGFLFGGCSSSPPSSSLPSSTPALIQHDSSSNTRNNGMSSPFCYNFSLPNPTSPGNAVVVGFTFENSPEPAVTDNMSNSYAIAENYFDAADNRSVAIAVALNVVAGARNISVCFSSDPGGYVEPMATEFDNVIAVDGPGSGNSGSGTSVTAGSLTPAVTGDVAYQITASFGGNLNQSNFAAGSETNITWSLLSADLMDGWAAQYGIYNSTAAINPAMSMATGGPWASAAILLKAGPSGGVPLGMRIVHLQHENIPTKTAAGGNGSGFTNPLALQVPSSGNLLIAMAGGGNPTCTISSVADSNGNAWGQAGSTYVYNNNDTVQVFYAANSSSSSNLSATVQWDTNNCDWTILFYDVTGAAASPLDMTNGSSGVAGDPPPFTVPYTITPSQPNELIFVEAIWDNNTGNGFSGTNQLFDANWFSGEPLDGPQPIDQNNGWGHVFASDTSPIGFTWTGVSNSQPFEGYASMAVAFRSASFLASQRIAMSIPTPRAPKKRP